LPRTVDNGKLNVHENEIGRFGFGFVDPALSVCSLDDRIARAGEEIAQDPAQVFLVFDDQDGLPDAKALRFSARIRSSI